MSSCRGKQGGSARVQGLLGIQSVQEAGQVLSPTPLHLT